VRLFDRNCNGTAGITELGEYSCAIGRHLFKATTVKLEEGDMDQIRKVALTTAGMIALYVSSNATADEVAKFRLVMHATSVQSQEVGDVDGHMLGLGRYSGLASFSDGSTGTANFVFTNDYTKGNGTNLAYFNITFKDGSVLRYKASGTARVEGTTTVFPEGPISVIGGTGRFEGAKGDGSQGGARLTPLAAGAELYIDVVINVKK